MTTPVTTRARPLAVPAVVVAALSGACVAVQGRFNGDLSAAGAGAFVASWISYAGTLATALVVMVALGRGPAMVRILRAQGRWWWYAIGLTSVPIVVMFAVGIPVVGVAIASVCSVAGQTIAGLAFDARGIGTVRPIRFTGRRVASALVAVAGLAVAVVGGRGGASASPAAVVGLGALIFLSGALLAGQQAGNGRVTLVTGDALLTAVTSTVGGLVGTTVLVGVAAVAGGLHGVALPDEPHQWYLYLGGPIGTAITAAAAWAVRHVGTFAMALGVVVGQMVTAVVVDLLTGVGAHPSTLAAVALVAVATVLVVLPRRTPTAAT